MLIEAIPIGSKYPLRFEISARELLEQIPHTQISELLDLINLPQIELTKETKEKIFNAIKRHRDMKLQGILIDVIASDIFSFFPQQPAPKEPIYYDCTLAKFAEQLDVPLWKAMEFGKYFRNKVEPNESEVLDIICKTLYPNYELEPSIRQQFTPLAHALYTAQKERIK